MLVKSFYYRTRSSKIGENVAPHLPTDSETLCVCSDSGYVNVGCFCQKKQINGVDYVAELDANSTADDVYGFVLGEIISARKIPNRSTANVLRITAPMVVSPLVVNFDAYRDNVKIIKWSNNHSVYPIGAIILSQSESTDDFSTITIDGRIRIINEE